MSEENLSEFATVLRNEVLARAETDALNGAFHATVFTQMMIDDLVEIGVLTDGEACNSEKAVKRKVARVNGYACSEEDDHLDLFVTIYRESDESIDVTREQADRAIQEAWRYFSGAYWGELTAGDESHEDYDMLCRIRELGPKLERLRVFLFTNGIVPENKKYELPEEGDFKRSVEVWGLRRLCRTRQSGATREPIEVDFTETLGSALPCLPHASEQSDYKAFLAVLPGVALEKLYEQHGERLLEMNVRSFLQARGKVNSGIRDTLMKAPGRFFAYNNGLTAIAEDIELTKPPAPLGILKLKGLQIVNGGQTTASIHRAAKKDKVDLSSVSVQLKLSVVKPELVDQIVPLISRNANSQNKVNDPDFSANHPWHQRVEDLSRTVWSPDSTSHWFYERTRGQYQVAKSRAKSSKDFDRLWPAAQVFTKTDLATAENTWDQLPQVVSLGTQKNFLKYTEYNATEHSPENVDAFGEQAFQALVARVMLFRATQSIVKKLAFPAYRANIVTYALAYLVYRRGTRIDLHRIWREQKPAPAIEEALRLIAKQVAITLKKSAGDRNVTEWCKKDDCWAAVQALKMDLPEQFWPGPKPSGNATGASVRAVSRRRVAATDTSPSPATSKTIAATPSLFAELGDIPVVDKRSDGGDFWVIGGANLTAMMGTLRERGHFFSYQPNGHAETGRRAAWRLRRE
jgi:hypothetical protein